MFHVHVSASPQSSAHDGAMGSSLFGRQTVFVVLKHKAIETNGNLQEG